MQKINPFLWFDGKAEEAAGEVKAETMYLIYLMSSE